MLVSGHLLSGNIVNFNADLTHCSNAYGTLDNEFGGTFGGYIDFYELVNDKQVADGVFFKFADLRYERNSTSEYIYTQSPDRWRCAMLRFFANSDGSEHIRIVHSK